jgi:hypothetical protein
MENKVEEISYKITGWMKSNRMGDSENEPCLWSIYELSSISSKPVKNAATNSDNFTIEGLEDSTKHLLECMSFSTHVKYFAVRLRTKKGDPGILNNFDNPYYQAPYNYKSSIGNLPAQGKQSDSTMMMMIGMLNGMQEDRRADREANQEMLTEIKLQNKDLEHKFKDYKSKQEIARLNSELENTRIGDRSFLKGLIEDFKPEIKEIATVFLAGKNTPYREEEDEEEAEDKGEQANDDINKQEILNNSLNMVYKNTKVKNPEVLFYKISTVLSYSDPAEVEQLLNLMQSRYEQIKSKKAANE